MHISSDERFKYVKSSQTGHWNVLYRARCTGHGNDFELIPAVRMKSQHSIGMPTCHDFPRFVIVSEKSRLEVGNRWRWSRFFGKKTLKGRFSNYSNRIHHLLEPCLVCKFRELWLTRNRQSHALFTWQKNKTCARSPALASARIASKTKQLQTIYSEFPKFHLNPVHFRRSYSRTHEHCWNAPQSISNTRRSFASRVIIIIWLLTWP